MRRISTLWKANSIAFISSFCVMVIELIAARIMAPYIGVSLYTWTSIIGVILAGIALGNYLGGRLADRRPSPVILSAIFFAGSLLTIAILPATKLFTSIAWFSTLPIMWNFTLKTATIFFLPAIVLSMVSPMVIKLTLADLGQTGGVVGTIYACSTAGSILGTFMTGFFFILWFGTRMTVWLVAAMLIVVGIIAWFFWEVTNRWHFSLKNFIIWTVAIEVIMASAFLFHFRESWEESYGGEIPYYSRESNYYTIKVFQGSGDVKVLSLDHLIHSYTKLDDPTVFVYDYPKVFAEMARYTAADNPAPRLLHLGGGGYTYPRYMETIYSESINDVVEIDPVVTEVAHEQLGLPADTSIKTYNRDARLFLIQRKSAEKYDFVIGDVFNDHSTPFHLTTLEFDKLIKANMTPDGIYLVNIIDNYRHGQYMPSFIHTLRQVFKNVYLFSAGQSWETIEPSATLVTTFVIAATDRQIDFTDYRERATEKGTRQLAGSPQDEAKLEAYLVERKPTLLTDDYVPTDIMVARLFHYTTR